MKTSPVWELYGAAVSIVMLLFVNVIVVDRRLSFARMSGLQRLCDAVLIVIASSLLIAYYSWAWGIFGALLVVIMRLVVGKVSFIRRSAQRLYRRLEPRIMKSTKNWHWLEWFAPSERDEAPAISSQSELRDIVTHSRLLSASEQKQFEQLFEKPKKVSEVMVPVDRLVSVGIDDTLGPLVLDDLHRSGYRQFPVIDGDIDHVHGMLYLDDIVDLKSSKDTVRSALDPRLSYATSDETVDHVLRRCVDARHNVVIVQDHDKKTLGMILLRDLLS